MSNLILTDRNEESGNNSGKKPGGQASSTVFYMAKQNDDA